MSSFSNKLYSRNSLMDSKVILHDMYYDTSVNFLCTYSLPYTAGICVVTYIRVYNTYLHGRCSLSALYSDTSCPTPSQSTLLFVSSDSSSHAYATSRSISLRTDQCHTSAEIQRALCLCSEHARHRLCFPLEGQCCECFTSS